MKVTFKGLGKVISILLTIICISTSYNTTITYAKDSDAITNEVILKASALLEAYQYNDGNSLNGVPIESLKLGNQIPVYTISEKANKLSDVSYYPLLLDSKVIGFFSAVMKDGNIVSLDYSDSLAEKISNLQEDSTIAFVNDGENFAAIVNGNEIKLKGSVIARYEHQNINCVSITAKENIIVNNSKSSMLTISSTNYKSLSVPMKLQSTDTSCWAASIACIVQYKRAISLEDKNVISSYENYFKTSPDRSLYCAEATFESIYKLPCSIVITNFNLSTLMTQINKDNPIYGNIFHMVNGQPQGAHTIVLNGYYTGSYYATFSYMDPWDGSQHAVTLSSDDSFIIVNNGLAYELLAWIELN